jgi:hypothetical protein
MRFSIIAALVAGLLWSPTAKADPSDAVVKKVNGHIASAWKANQVSPAQRADDAEFMRRVYLDLIGRIPPVKEVRDFLDNTDPNKRSKLIDDLLFGKPDETGKRNGSAGYVAHFGNIWRREWLPQSMSNPQFQFFGPQFESWMRKQLQNNTPYDRIVRDIVTAQPFGAQGQTPDTQALSAFLFVNENKPENVAASVSRMFLGVKIECAQCHDHPFETWTRNQFWEFASFFAGLQPTGMARRLPAEAVEIRSLTIPDLNKKVSAKFLDGKEPLFQDRVSSRVTLMDWMSAKGNPYFARNAVNRMWAYFFGAGLIDPLDEPGEQNPPSHPQLLEDLSQAFTASGYDLKFLIRVIVSSDAYQLSSADPKASASTERNFARMRVRGLTPEQLFDSLVSATYYRDMQMPNQRQFVAPNSARGEFLAKFSTTERLSDVQTSILQALTLMNGKLVSDLTSTDVRRSELLAGVLDTPFFNTEQKIETLYLAVVTRKPTPDELRRLTGYVDKGGATGDSRKALADVFWALLNSSEFAFNH